MQATSVIFTDASYVLDMPAGRPSKLPRSVFGERLCAARSQVGLSQIQVAAKLGVTQQTYAGWERKTTALKPEHINQLANILNVSVDFLLGRESKSKKRGGPVGKLRRVFEEASQLPRTQQSKVAEFVEGFVKLHSNGEKQVA